MPTLKLSEPPGAVRPDGNLTIASRIACPGQSPVNFITKSPIVPLYNGMMLMNSITNLVNAKSGFGTMNGASQPKMPGDSKAGKQKK